jgi:hypothetical protein
MFVAIDHETQFTSAIGAYRSSDFESAGGVGQAYREYIDLASASGPFEFGHTPFKQQ